MPTSTYEQEVDDLVSVTSLMADVEWKSNKVDGHLVPTTRGRRVSLD
jgi:hypothetical protein